MKLANYLKRHKLTTQQFAQRIGVADFTLRRYLAGRVPEPRLVEKIYSETGGKVRPADFYNLVKQ